MQGYGGFSTGGSNNISMSNGKFSQDVYKPQGKALNDLWNNAYNQFKNNVGQMEAQLPGAVAGANQTFANAQDLASSLGAGGAYQGISGADIANRISGSNQPLLDANAPGYANTQGSSGRIFGSTRPYTEQGPLPVSGFGDQGPGFVSNQGPGFANMPSNPELVSAQGPGYQSLLSTPELQRLPGYRSDTNLPGQINTNQSNLVDQMRLTRGTNNPFLGQAGLVQQDTNPNQTSNQQKIYESIMGGSGNSYADALKNQMQNDALRTAGTSLNALDARAARAGMSGSSRQGIAQGQALQGINQNLQSNLTNLGYSTFDKDLAQKLDIARQADQANVQRYLGNQQYNLGLVGAGNTAAQNAQNYNLGMGGLGNAQNQANLNYNLGLGSNTNTFNQNAQNYNLGYGQNVNAFNQGNQNYNLGMNQALMNYNLGQQQANQNYNLGLGSNANIGTQNAQNYNLGLTQANQGYNLGLTQANQGYDLGRLQANQGYDLGRLQANQNYNLGQMQGIQNYNLGLDANNVARQNLLTGMVGGQQGSMNTGAQFMPTVQGMASGGMNQFLVPGQLTSQWADTIGGPIVLGSGRTSSASQGSSNAFGMGGGGGVGGGGGGGGGGTVICTELHRQGLMSDEIYAYDDLFGEMIRMISPETYDGYISWAPKVVDKMRKSKLLTKAINIFAKPWSKEMARRMGSNHKFSLVGFVIMELGLAVCSTIGTIKKEMEVA
jgi:hypothetical protein